MGVKLLSDIFIKIESPFNGIEALTEGHGGTYC